MPSLFIVTGWSVTVAVIHPPEFNKSVISLEICRGTCPTVVFSPFITFTAYASYALSLSGDVVNFSPIFGDQ